MSKLKKIGRTCLDVSMFVLVCFAEFALNVWFEPWRRGFFCDDETLAYPYRESSVSIITVVIVVLTVPMLVILVVEIFKRLQDSGELLATPVVKQQSKTRRRLLACYKQLGCYLFGLGLTVVATDIAKLSAGRLRPHFFAVCQPELLDGSTCDDDKNQNIYIEQYNCRGMNSTPTMLRDVSQSFPSGHSSIIWYAMLYVCIYLQASLSTRASKLLKHLLQFVFIMLAVFVALSRIAEYWHHWSDVLAGALLGCFFAIVVSLYLANLFVKPDQSNGSSVLKSMQPKIPIVPKPPATTTLPAYTFGSMPYMAAQYGQPYHNYGYVS